MNQSYYRTADIQALCRAVIICRRRGYDQPLRTWLECLRTGLVPWWADGLWKD